ncbi:MAG: M24 family metallopeptidase, partial [Candidatus Dormibacteria bacterium]
MADDPYRAKRPSDEEFAGRLLNVRAAMRAREIDGLVVFSAYMEREGNVLYLTGHRNVFPPWASDSIRNGVGLSSLVIPPDGPVTLFSSYRADAKTLAPTVDHVIETLDLCGAIAESIRQRYGSSGPRTLGIAGSDVMTVLIYRRLVDAFPGTRWETVDDLLVALRAEKSPYEQHALRRAAAVADQGIRAALAAAVEGATEQDVALAAHRACVEAGADHVVRTRLRAGDEILAQGRWPLATARKIRSGELVYMDLLGWVDNYAFDVARTWGVGPLSDELVGLVAASNKLLDATISAIRPGTTGGQVVSEVGAQFSGTVWDSRYYPMGHGVGIECVENPWIMPGATMQLREGMVLSLEPSFVIPGVSKAQQ